VNVPILEARAVIGVIAVTVVVIAWEVTERSAPEGSSEAVMPVVEAAAQAGAMKLAATKAAHACAPKSSHGAAANVAAAKSTTYMSTTESTAHVAASESAATAHVAASESAAAAVPGGHGVRPGCRAECDDGEEDHGPACDGLLPDDGR
jgi:hypothetical protein